MNDDEYSHQVETLFTLQEKELTRERHRVDRFFRSPTILGYRYGPFKYCYWFQGDYFLCSYQWQLPDSAEVITYDDLSPEQQTQMVRIVLEAEERYAV